MESGLTSNGVVQRSVVDCAGGCEAGVLMSDIQRMVVYWLGDCVGIGDCLVQVESDALTHGPIDAAGLVLF